MYNGTIVTEVYKMNKKLPVLKEVAIDTISEDDIENFDDNLYSEPESKFFATSDLVENLYVSLHAYKIIH